MITYLYSPINTLHFMWVWSCWNCVQQRYNLNSAFEVQFVSDKWSSKLIRELTTLFLRPRKMSFGSENSMWNWRYLIGNQKNTWRKLTTGIIVYKTVLWITEIIVFFGRGSMCLTGWVQILLYWNWSCEACYRIIRMGIRQFAASKKIFFDVHLFTTNRVHLVLICTQRPV